MRSEGDKIKYITSPARDKKYAIVAYSKFMVDCIQQIPSDVITILSKAIIEICSQSSAQTGFQMASTV